jgi:hypothetical protein
MTKTDEDPVIVWVLEHTRGREILGVFSDPLRARQEADRFDDIEWIQVAWNDRDWAGRHPTGQPHETSWRLYHQVLDDATPPTPAGW